MNEHIVRSYGDELKQLTSDVTRLGGLAEAQVSDALDALSRRDVALAKSVVARDQKLDDLQAEIERATFRLIALRQPMAVDLRHAVAALKLSMTLERCGEAAVMRTFATTLVWRESRSSCRAESWTRTVA